MQKGSFLQADVSFSSQSLSNVGSRERQERISKERKTCSIHLFFQRTPSWKGRNHTRLTIPARLVKRPSVKRPLKKRRRERATIQRQDPPFNFYDRSNLQLIGFHLYKCWQSWTICTTQFRSRWKEASRTIGGSIAHWSTTCCCCSSWTTWSKSCQ